MCRENPEFVGLEVDPGPDGDSGLVGQNISSFEIPVCESCGGTLQPDVVFYGGAVPKARVQLVRDGLDRSKVGTDRGILFDSTDFCCRGA